MGQGRLTIGDLELLGAIARFDPGDYRLAADERGRANRLHRHGLIGLWRQPTTGKPTSAYLTDAGREALTRDR